ncbi:cytochrome P450 monooxygenase hasH [Aspergillus neoniger CBS 115656]|uniref:Cytochrome P450 n=1 Tax=Aspergillus neoniger (strain CBS 115656) TaxID=1448310 RepID=A0A318Z4M4_ASPNB|nr:cytochrome P450 [Aspergillus neoniger CBS 115656]PYH35118.1 cytochrome P450 [Aspergillus neoniger CBS 115656]
MSAVRPVNGDKMQMPGPEYLLPQGQARDKIIAPSQMSAKWHAEYGSIYRIWNGVWPEIVITDPKDVEAWFSGKGEHSKFSFTPSGALFNYAMGHAVGLINGHEWKVLRKLLDPYVNFSSSAKLTPLIFQRAVDHVQHVPAQTLAPSKENIIVNAYRAVQSYPFFTQMETFYGPLTQVQKEEVWAIGQIFLVLSTWVVEQGLTRSRLLKYFYSIKAWVLIRQFDQRWRTFNREVVDQKRTQTELPIIRLWTNVENGDITEDQLIHTFTESIFANLDVTTSVITGCVLHIAENKRIQKKLQMEIDEHQDNLAEYIKRQDTFLHWCFLESIRLEPIPAIAFSLAGRCTEDKILGGYHIPANTSVVIDAYSININNPYWGPDTKDYRPERFEGLNPRELKYNLSTFGYGSRKCLGVHLGGKMVRSIVAALLSQYDVDLEGQAKDGDRYRTDESSFFAKYLANIQLTPRTL